MKNLCCDYLVVGAGATGLSFVDEIINNSEDYTVVMVDRRSKPGGHWMDAYEFVKLHQPASYYGVNSKPLETKEGGGEHPATKAQILAYYEQVLAELIGTGRVTWLPLCDYKGDGKIVSLTQAGREFQVHVRRKTVDATRLETHVPSTKEPNYKVANNANLVPINALSRINKPWSRYIVIGAGKTGVDALAHLMDTGVSSDAITWIISNDCWWWTSCTKRVTHIQDMVKGILESNTLQDIYYAYEKSDIFMRVDNTIVPTKFRAGTVSEREMMLVRSIKDKVRQGKVARVNQTEIIFENGYKIPTDGQTLIIDCSTTGSAFAHPKPLFCGDTINLQMVMVQQAPYSAAIIAALELKYPDDEETKNKFIPCGIYLEEKYFAWGLDAFFSSFRDQLSNAYNLEKMLGMDWLRKSRLSGLKYFGEDAIANVVKNVGGNKEKLVEKLTTILKKNKTTNMGQLISG